jgi:hypothetical protein
VVGAGTPTPSSGPKSTPTRPLAYTIALGSLCFLIPLGLLGAAFVVFGGGGAAAAGVAAAPSVVPADPPE